jgi:hypothetical protein
MSQSGARFEGHLFALRLDDGPTPGVCLLRDGRVGRDRRIPDFVVEVASLEPSGLLEWVAGSWTGSTPRRAGAILSYAPDHTISVEQAFGGALISETVVPALDASAAEPAFLTVRFVSTTSKTTTNPGGKLVIPLDKGNLKRWLPSNFSLEIAGLDCTKVSRVGAFTIRRDVAPTTTPGNSSTAGPVDFPDLRVYLSASSAQSWVAWRHEFVGNGQDALASERSGIIRLLGPDVQAELARIELAGLQIRLLEPEEDVGRGQVARLMADLHCARMTLVPGGAP